MPGGDLREYIKVNPQANLISLVRISFIPPNIASTSPQLLGVAKGIGYLHSHNIIHGGIKGVRGIV